MINKPLIWTSDKPTQEGWYWLLYRDTAVVSQVKPFRAFGGRLCSHHPIFANIVPVEEIRNELWAGPIPYPVEP